MNEIVKYDNYMNSLRFSGFTPIDYNFLMVLCNKLRDKETTEITISFNELREKTGYTQHPIKQFVSDLERMNEKLMKITCKLRVDSKTIMFVLFPTFITDDKEQTLTVSVNERFKFILNEITKNFTRFELNEFIELDSKYSKNIYRLLKQYRTTGKYEVSIEDFREKVDCPESYSSKHIMDKIIKPYLKELQNYFQDLKCEPQYARKRGNPVTGYIFSFTPESRNNQVDHSTKANNNIPEKNKKSQSKYSSFPQREYNYEELEKVLLNQTIAEKVDSDQL